MSRLCYVLFSLRSTVVLQIRTDERGILFLQLEDTGDPLSRVAIEGAIHGAVQRISLAQDAISDQLEEMLRHLRKAVNEKEANASASVDHDQQGVLQMSDGLITIKRAVRRYAVRIGILKHYTEGMLHESLEDHMNTAFYSLPLDVIRRLLMIELGNYSNCS